MGRLPCSALLFSLAVLNAHAAPLTGVTGNGDPFDNYQPTLAITEVIATSGIFPSRGPGSGGASGGMLGFVYGFAGNFAPGGSALTQGQTTQIVQNTALFSLLGTQYGGNGQTTFSLPDLAGRAIVGDSVGTPVGSKAGAPTATLTLQSMPAHTHTVPGDTTGSTGSGGGFDNTQPVLSMRRLIATQGIFPSNGGGSGSASFMGQVATFAGNFTPVGWTEADGRVLSIAQNSALFALIGTTYGGDGITTFALPDLRDRVSVGAGNGLSLGTMLGSTATTVSVAQMPAHTHTLPTSGSTDPTGGNAPVSNMQPSLALNYIISLQGIFPSNGGGGGFDPDDPFLGQISEFAGNFAPSGWALANGQLLPINQNQALFALLGTTYGGDGRTTFALPDFRGRTAVGWGLDDFGNNISIGAQFGAPTVTLNSGNLPAHLHTLSDPPAPPPNGVPEPATLLLLLLGLPLVARRR